MGQVGWQQMEPGTFPLPWARRGFGSAGLVAVTQRRESCWGLSPPQGLPGPGPCHTLLRGLFPRARLAQDAGGSSGSPRSLWSPMLLSPRVTDAPVPCISLVTEASVPVVINAAVPFYPSGHLTNAPVTSVSLSLMLLSPFIPVVTDASVPSVPLVWICATGLSRLHGDTGHCGDLSPRQH